MAYTAKPACSECTNLVKARGYCANHYSRFMRHGHPGYTRATNDGAAKHPNYSSFAKMKQRCYNPNSNRFWQYGGRGITVCDRWMEAQGFWNFVSDMGVRPGPDYSINRIDNDGDYEPTNCEWATIHQQTANRTTSLQTPGVQKHSRGKGWTAQLMVDKKLHYLGYFTDYTEAVQARKNAEVEYGVH